MNEIDDLIREIAVKHNIALSPDDPLMILPTIQQRLLVDFNESLEEKLISFREELELASRQWSDTTKAKLENMVERIIDDSREQAIAVIQDETQGLPQAVRQTLRSEISSQLAPVIKKSHKLLWLILLIAVISLLASIASLWMTLS